jgi:hypothetical protein
LREIQRSIGIRMESPNIYGTAFYIQGPRQTQPNRAKGNNYESAGSNGKRKIMSPTETPPPDKSMCLELHGWQSECDPLKCKWKWKTFSISFFRIVLKSNGKGTKKKSVGYRLRGPSIMRDAMIKRADEIVEKMNNGWKPNKKSEKL